MMSSLKQSRVVKRFGMAFVAVCTVAMALTGTGLVSAASTRPDASAHTLKFIFIEPNAASSNATDVSLDKGLIQAGKDLGVTTIFRGPESAGIQFNAAQALSLLQQAIAEKPDGLVIDDFEPTAMNGAIKQAVADGIPVVLSLSGYGQAPATGALTYVGNDDTRTGLLGGQLLSQHSKHALLVTATDTIPYVAMRNSGFLAGFKGKVTVLTAPLSDFGDPTAMRNLVEIALNKDTTIDGTFSIGSAASAPIISAVQSLGASRHIYMGGIDITAPVITALEAHTYLFTLDQQAYLQGYLPAQILAQYIRYDLVPTVPFMPTGPVEVTPQNASRIAQLVDEGYR
jgi:simple sugar transport system substrate-binding protein